MMRKESLLMSKTLLIGLGVATLVAVMAKKAKQYYDQLQVRFSGFTIDELILTGSTTVTFFLDIYNPTPVDLTVNSLMGDIYVNNYYVGLLENYTEQIIKSYSASRVQATMSVPTVKLASSLVKLLQTKANNVAIRYDGYIVVAGVNLKLNFTTNV